MKQFNLKALTTSVSAVIMATVATQAHASDIEIYKVADTGQKTIVMMLDTSGSMRECDVSVTLNLVDADDDGNAIQIDVTNKLYSLNYWNFERQYGIYYASSGIYPNRATINAYSGTEKSNTVPQYDRNFCYGQSRPGVIDRSKIYEDRMTKLKGAIFDLMDSNKLDDSIHVAVGQFTDGTKGTIQVPSAPLTDEHRARIKAYVARLEASGGTPTATAYATAAAYMMGTTTVAAERNTQYTRQLWVEYPVNSNTFIYCGRKDATNPSTTSDAFNTLNVDATGACTGISHSTASKTRRQALSEGFKIEACRGLNGGGEVYSNRVGNIRTNCLYKDSETVVISSINNGAYSGFAQSVTDSKNGSNYKTPLPTQGRECSGQSIYFLTDGYPNNVNNSQYYMRAALGDKAGDFPETAAAFNDTSKYLNSSNGEGMAPAGELAKRLRDPARNPQGVSVTTALVGFGADFAEAKNVKRALTDAKGRPREYYDCSKIARREIRNACNFGEKSHAELPNVGGYGEGGFFYAEDSQDLIDSFIKVAEGIEIEFNPIATGSPTIPVNSLNRQVMLSDAYYASFTPQPDKAQQLWTGNMNKYTTQNSTLFGSNNQPLFGVGGVLNENALGMWDRALSDNTTAKGVLGNLKLQESADQVTQRKVYTEMAGRGNARVLNAVTVNSFRTGGALQNSPVKNYWLNLLGYNIPKDATVNVNELPTAELRQLGATMHSNPILLTQSGITQVNDNGKLEDSNRDDYILYGSTQGVLHLVDSNTGEEVFAFVPQKMVDTQKEAFLHESSTTGGRNQLFYGIDAPWVNHTEYVSREDGALTVGSSDPTDANAPKGKQWVYGGLRMGGKNYYGLDLSNIANNTKRFDPVTKSLVNAGQVTGEPVLKFTIDPDERAVYSATTRKDYPELAHMGQSWSKPALGYVNWPSSDPAKNGRLERRLVMFVGGGYDEGYETSDYKQTNGKGAGVYMFDAETGDLLWWASNNSVTGGKATKHSATGDDTSSLQYSVVSRINTFDRNSDGLIDALYFGDLAGQGFRIDLDNSKSGADFSVRVVKIFDEHKADGTSPRFYDMPSISIHDSETAGVGRFAVVAFGSGDRSSPLAGERVDVLGRVVTHNAKTADDMAIVVYDYDVGNPRWQNRSVALATRAGVGKPALKPAEFRVEYKGTESEVKADGTNQGWKYVYPAEKRGGVKSFGEPYAITNLLFVNTYNRDEPGVDGKCGSGVLGASRTLQFCLPTGICEQAKHGYVVDNNKPISSTSTPGLVEMTLGGKGEGISNLGNVSATETNSSAGGGDTTNSKVNCSTNPESPECLNVETPSTITQLRWFESRVQGKGN